MRLAHGPSTTKKKAAMNALCMGMLSNPRVQRVMTDFLDLDASGLARIEDATGQEEIREAIGGLFDALRTLLSDAQLRQQVEELAGDLDTGHDPHAEALAHLDGARDLCCCTALPQTIVALALMRRYLAALGSDANDEAAVVAAVDGIVALLAPGVSVLEHWERNRTGCARLWEALNKILGVLDRHCPSSPPAPTSE